jgi:hypothetical protein
MRQLSKGIEGITILFSHLLEKILCLEVIGELLAFIFLDKGRLNEVLLIHWQALRLWLKGIPFHMKESHAEKQTDAFRVRK